MENQKLHDWEKTVDLAENQPLTVDLPTDYPLGGHYYQDVLNERSRDWMRVQIVSGRVAGRWAYWSSKEEYKIVADTIFNGDASHFLGMLGVPHNGIPGPAWVLISPRMTPPPEEKIYEEKKRERYERSHEIYDVETGTATQIPGRPR